MPYILIVEDDANIREGIAATLASEGYETGAAANGEEALARYHERRPDLILLDIMMPKKSGYDVCRELRGHDTATPVIMLTAKGEEIDKVVGLTLGADDYITKPFGVRELLARVAAVLRRAGGKTHAEPDAAGFDFGTAHIDIKRYAVATSDGEHALSDREMKLLKFLHAHPGEVLTRDRLLNAAWGVGYFGNTRTLDQHVAQLRKKLGDAAGALQTVHGIGYRYKTES